MVSYEQFSKIQKLAKQISSSLASKFSNESDNFLNTFETNILGDLLQMDDDKLIKLSSSSDIPNAYLELFSSRKNEINDFVHENIDKTNNYMPLFDKTADEVKADRIKEDKKILNEAVFFNPYLLMNYLKNNNIPYDVKLKTIRTMSIMTQCDFEQEQEKEQGQEYKAEQEEEIDLFK